LFVGSCFEVVFFVVDFFSSFELGLSEPGFKSEFLSFDEL